MTTNKDEKQFLNTYDSAQFDKISLTTDLLVFSISDVKTTNYRKLAEKKMSVFLINRDQFPFKDKWSLPGGFVRPTDTLEETAKRVLQDKVKINNLYFEQLYTFGAIDRDPRMRIVSVAYMALVNRRDLPGNLQHADNWFTVNRQNNTIILTNENNPELRFDLSHDGGLAFDHTTIIQTGLNRLKNKVEYTDLAFHLLPTEFTLTELQNVYEAVLGKKLLAPAFRRAVKSRVTATGNMTGGLGHRPSALYQYTGEPESVD